MQRQNLTNTIHVQAASLLRITATGLFIGLSMLSTYMITAGIHEAGHASACIALGGNVGGFRHWLHTVWSLTPSTDCSIKPIPAIVWSAGPVISIAAWLASAVIAATVIKRGIYSSIVWACWSFWYLSSLGKEVYHAYAPPSVWQDTTQFVHTTSINPNLVGIPLAAIFTGSLLLWGRIQYRLLPEFLRIFCKYRRTTCHKL